MKNSLIFMVCLFLNCAGKHPEQKDHAQPTENNPQETAPYIIDIYKQNRKNNRQEIYSVKDSFFVRDSVYKVLSKKKTALEKRFAEKTETYTYPAYYGGSYVNKREGRLYINVVDSLDNPTTRRDIRKRVGSGYFNIQPCSYSINMLRDTLYALETLFNKKKKILPSSLVMSRFEIYEQHNTILVLLEDSTSEVVLAFKKYLMDTPMIQFAPQPILYLH